MNKIMAVLEFGGKALDFGFREREKTERQWCTGSVFSCCSFLLACLTSIIIVKGVNPENMN